MNPPPAVRRRVFYSFHYDADVFRTQTVRQIGALEGNTPASPNAWEEVKRGGDDAIKRWIDTQMSGRSCVVVLVGAGTANRKWINYEIVKAWNDGKGVVGIRIHGLKDQDGYVSQPGPNPFDFITLENGRYLSSVVRCYDPPGMTSKERYAWICQYLSAAFEEAIKVRKDYRPPLSMF